VKLLAKMMDPTCSDDALDLAKEMIEALDASRTKRDMWIVSARTMKNAPVITVGVFSTKNQAMKAASTIPFCDDPEVTPGVGALIHNMKPPEWLAAI
jgi:phosphoribosylcarboxyaminoimidazole (NCAIR) mutase